MGERRPLIQCHEDTNAASSTSRPPIYLDQAVKDCKQLFPAAQQNVSNRSPLWQGSPNPFLACIRVSQFSVTLLSELCVDPTAQQGPKYSRSLSCSCLECTFDEKAAVTFTHGCGSQTVAMDHCRALNCFCPQQ
ncbi:hypothetical protein UY3_14062 [Chelonia mydas]|uniref:Uncharacterized protein n=1 Tax=Chelonia mydas TaxID=8469 RepID=M7B0D0_CHEMY|nr:hypothetical protein UY3_14062 [Chelonia mydas]